MIELAIITVISFLAGITWGRKMNDLERRENRQMDIYKEIHEERQRLLLNENLKEHCARCDEGYGCEISPNKKCNESCDSFLPRKTKSLQDTVISEMERISQLSITKIPWATDSTGLRYPLYYAELGAAWRRERDKESLSQDLDQAAADYENEMWEAGHSENTYTSSDIIRAVKYGAMWQKQWKSTE